LIVGYHKLLATKTKRVILVAKSVWYPTSGSNTGIGIPPAYNALNGGSKHKGCVGIFTANKS